ncbi:MAG: hypothetical protein BIFFINMI_00032 [Phycisphaerae bacterium]|nr:hypothetical protein [Phycisphaerae bacterium]
MIRFRLVIPLFNCLLLTGCAPTPPAPPSAGPGVHDWRDRILADGWTLQFRGPRIEMTFTRRGEVMRMRMRPVAWSVPRVQMTADAPRSLADPPKLGAAGFSELLYDANGLTRPYRIRIDYPGGQAGAATTAPDFNPCGVVRYFFSSRPPDQPHVMGFDSGLYSPGSAMHLVMIALSPLPTGRTSLLAVHREGKDYFATIDATPTRRELHFPKAMLWADWSAEQLALESVFIVEDFDRWPQSTITVRNFSRLDPASASYESLIPPAPTTQPE